ncbi:hypothetical protein HPB47_018089 [Ixodes persulcatus]|uniref:Uncharacterized protein n=1 Tax=Ixodes persulcatus TaxID=34615 RepID=A0AC60QMF6_IXOPE|nr:hypothetical protein HPB47_018089 [Ixodes persulcatus]
MLPSNFFRETPAAVRYRVEQGQLPPEAETTAWFCELVSAWFILKSSRHPAVALSHFDRKQHEAAIHKLDLTTRTFREMKMGSTAHWKPLQAGVIASTTVVYQLHEDLLNDHGYGGQAVPQESAAAEEDDIIDDFLVMLTKEEGHMLAYVAGFLLRAVLKHVSSNTCKGALTSNSKSEYSALIKLKEFVRGAIIVHEDEP